MELSTSHADTGRSLFSRTRALALSSNAMTTVKPLLVAEHASARFGGEALIPYQYFKWFRKLGVDAHLLVHERTRQELCQAFPRDLERLHFVADSFINIWCHKLSQLLPDRLATFTLGAIGHWDTQIRQRRIARALVKQHGLHLVHEPIPVSPKLPSMMFGLAVPVVIGPMNGGMDYPPGYDTISRIERVIVGILRWSAAFWNVVLPGKRRAALILVSNKRTYDALPSALKRKEVIELVENGVDLERFSIRSNEAGDKGGPLDIIFLGRLVDCKRVDLLLDAAERLRDESNFRIHVVGDGPERHALERKVKQAHLTGHVKFHGWLAQAEAAELVRSADVMVLPSMRECGGAVVMEAMASGVPVIAAKWGGPADYLTVQTGVLIEPGTPASFVAALADAIRWMADNPDARRKMGRAARRQVELHYDWRVKASTLLRIYEAVLRAPAGLCKKASQ
jgi:glycosyltransferase involved in cell wall biosynthesis